MLAEIIILGFIFVIAYFFIVVPSVKLWNLKENMNKPNGCGVSNSVVFNTQTKTSEAQQIPTTD